MAGKSTEYDVYVPLIVEHASLPGSHPQRARIREQLVAGFLPVARHIARRFARGGEPAEDLQQVAVIGLLHALDRFDPERGRDFLSYAVPTMMGEVRRYFRDSTWAVRTPRGVKERFLVVGAAAAALSQQLGRAPTVGELAEHLTLTDDEVAEALAAHGSYRPASLDEALGDDENALVDVLGRGDPEYDRVELRALVHDLMRRVPERERHMLVLRFVEEKTQSEIASVLCISQMHVSRLLSRTLAQLRRAIEEELASSSDTVDSYLVA